MKAKLLIQSNNINTYINVMAALCDRYSVEEIMLSFVEREPDELFITHIQKELLKLSHDPIYSKASRVSLQDERASSNHSILVKGWDILDVTGVSKEIAINISAASISNKKVCVCQLSWQQRFKKGEKWILKKGNHNYTDLMSAGALSKLYDDHFEKRNVIIAFTGLFCVMFVVAIAKIINPSFVVPDDIISLFSLLISAAGLYLAKISLTSRNP